ncbi:MAG: flippase-like domain-containing protein [Bacteroides sp.]|nr:flippase-like domain-containing protein [Bacteroides sp.]
MPHNPGIFKKRYILLPVLIGLGVIAWMLTRDFEPDLFREISFDSRTWAGIIAGVLFILGRDLELIIRYRIITDGALTWRQATKVNMLCEFTSVVTPSNVGGSSLIFLFLTREGIPVGRSTALMISCLFLDEFFLVVSCPLLLLFLPIDQLFGDATLITVGMKYLFVAVYLVIVALTLLLFTALFIRPAWVTGILRKVIKLPFLRRWSGRIGEFNEYLQLCFTKLKIRSFTFWLKAFATTVFSWCSRYLVVVAVIFAFSPVGNYFLAFARQFVIWVLMLISPTPGGSGFSEFMFGEYYNDFFPIAGITLVAAFVWRLITYYPYLIIGAIIVPRWVQGFKKA